MSPQRLSFVVVILGCAAVLVFSAACVQAEIILPTGLAPGSRYEIAFVTADSTIATSSDINYYDNFVRTEATQDSVLAGLGVSWNAIASTDSVNAVVNAPYSPNIPIYNTCGQLLTNSTHPLYLSAPVGGGLLAGLYTQSGGTQSASYVWTGSDFSGHESVVMEIVGGVAHYAYNGLGDAMPGTGDPSLSSYYWLNYTYVASSQSLPLYALSSPITVPVPEPATLVLLGIGAVSLLAYAWRRR